MQSLDSISLEGKTYQLREIISKGGQGIVFQGHDVDDSQLALAIKEVYGVVRIGQERDPEMSNIHAQVQLWRQLSSSTGFVRLHESGFADNGRYYIVMDFVAGETLEERAKQGTRYNKQEATDLLMHLLQSLQQAHERGILYRDVKPENIKMTTNGPVFVDIGAIGDQYATTRTMGVGTLGYVAPEQMNLEPVVASDIYALGKTMYRVLTGQAVSRSELSADDFKKIKLSYGGLGNIIEKMCQPELADRYQTTGNVLEDIARGDVAAPLVHVKTTDNNLPVRVRMNTFILPVAEWMKRIYVSFVENSALGKAWSTFWGGVASRGDQLPPEYKYTPLQRSQRELIKQDYDNVCYSVDSMREPDAKSRLKEARKRVMEYGWYDLAQEKENEIMLKAYYNAQYWNGKNDLTNAKQWEAFANSVKETRPLIPQKTDT